MGGTDQDLTFVLRRTAPVTADKSPDRRERLSNVDVRTFRVLMTDAAFTTDAHVKLEKPAFFFGDHIKMLSRPAVMFLVHPSLHFGIIIWNFLMKSELVHSFCNLHRRLKPLWTRAQKSLAFGADFAR